MSGGTSSLVSILSFTVVALVSQDIGVWVRTAARSLCDACAALRWDFVDAVRCRYAVGALRRK